MEKNIKSSEITKNDIAVGEDKSGWIPRTFNTEDTEFRGSPWSDPENKDFQAVRIQPCPIAKHDLCSSRCPAGPPRVLPARHFPSS